MNTLFQNLSDIIYEPVNEQYGYGKYGTFRVLIRKADGYVNATKLCADGMRRFENWLRLDTANALIAELKSVLQKEVCDKSQQDSLANHGGGT